MFVFSFWLRMKTTAQQISLWYRPKRIYTGRLHPFFARFFECCWKESTWKKSGREKKINTWRETTSLFIFGASIISLNTWICGKTGKTSDEGKLCARTTTATTTTTAATTAATTNGNDWREWDFNDTFNNRNSFLIQKLCSEEGFFVVK